MAARRTGSIVGAVLLAATVLTACDPQPVPLVVDSGGATGDAAPGDGACVATGGGCTLRAAIEEANATAGLDVVRIATGVAPSLGGAQVPISAPLDLRGGGATLRDRIVHTGGALTVRDLTIADVATTSGCGGALTSTGASVTLERVVVRDSSTAGNHGGGVCTSGALALVDSHVTGNRVTGSINGTGGGVRTTAALTVLRSTIADNGTRGGLGTEVSVAGSGPLTVGSSTVAGGADGVSALLAPSATGSVLASTLGPIVAVSPSVTARGTALLGCAPGGAPSLGGFDGVGDGCGTAGPTDVVGTGVDPLWVAGTATPTQAPSVGSPLLDVIPAGTPGLCVGGTVDQRGRPRLVGAGCDIGAVERQTRITATRGVPLDTPTAKEGIVHAVNASGVAVGASPSYDWLPQYPPAAYRWAPDGTRTTLAPTGVAYDVDAGGTVVGVQMTGPSTSSATRWSPAGVAQVIAPPAGDTSATAMAVDDAGRVFGRSWSSTTASRAWWRTAALGAATILPSFGRAQAYIVDDDDHGRVLGRLTAADGSGSEWVVWDVVAGTATLLTGPVVPSSVAGATYTAIDEHAVYGSVGRPELGNGCEDEYGNHCTIREAFALDLDAGSVTLVPAPPGPFVSVADVDGRGRALVEAARYSYDCAGCPLFAYSLQVVDVATSEVTPLDPPVEGAAIGDGGHVLGSGFVGSVGNFQPSPYRFATTG